MYDITRAVMEKEKEKEKAEKKSGMGGISLRKKSNKAPPRRPTIVGGPAPQVRTQDKKKVADLVKRRYSTRFISTPLPIGATGVPPIPSVPAIPRAFGTPPPLPGNIPARKKSEVAPTDLEGGQGVDVELSDYQATNFDAGSYISSVLSNASEAEVRDYQENLKARRRRASTDLQQNVYVNRSQFIMISKEIDNVKSEMRALRNLLGELDLTTQSLKLGSENEPSQGLSPGSPGENYLPQPIAKYDRSNRRNSIADLTQMWASQLRLLWEKVENSQKYLPVSTGRHIVMDSPNWVELNSATWKPMRQIHMFLLNDNLLVASLKKRRPDAANRTGPATKLFAENCWPLVDIEMVDLAPTSATNSLASKESVLTAINIRVGKESFVYRSDKSEKKQKLLMTFKKTLDEYKKAQRAETEDQNRVRDNVSFFTARDPSMSGQSDLLRSLSTSIGKTGDRPMLLIDVDGKQRNLRWFENQIDELDEVIAHQTYEDSVARVEMLRRIATQHAKTHQTVSEYITIKMDERALRLAGMVTAQLVENAGWKTHVRKNVQWLIRLDFEDRAREAFLDARTQIMKKRTRQVRFEGDIPSYISQIALVQFTLIRNTVDTYNSCFEYRLSSPLVRWAKHHVEAYSDLLTRQLSSVHREDEVYQQCLDYTTLHSTMLAEVGLDFKEQLAPKVGIEE